MTGSRNSDTHYRSADIDGIEVAYREAGPSDGRVVLLLHGFPTSSRMFRNLMPYLSDRYRVIAPDYPGFGHSGVPDRARFRYSFDNLADVVDKLLLKLDVGSFTPYMMDFGGPIGYRLCVKYPERLSAVVLQNAPLYPEAPEGWWATLGQYWQDGSAKHREESRAYLTPESIRDQYLFGVKDPSLVDPDAWLVDVALMRRPGVDEIMLDLLYDIRNNRSTFAAMQELIRNRRPPTLVVTGFNDEIFPGDTARKILDDLPAAEFHAIDSGHFALEDKAPQIGPLMRDFLDRCVKAPVRHTV
jgi:pimeloyl-ACP methyl ester carboxylesterase